MLRLGERVTDLESARRTRDNSPRSQAPRQQERPVFRIGGSVIKENNPEIRPSPPRSTLSDPVANEKSQNESQPYSHTQGSKSITFDNNESTRNQEEEKQ